jgi:hypothetical protein
LYFPNSFNSKRYREGEGHFSARLLIEHLDGFENLEGL